MIQLMFLKTIFEFMFNTYGSTGSLPTEKSFKCYIWRCIWHLAKRSRSQPDEQASRGQLRYLFHFFSLSLFLRNSFSLSLPEVHEVLGYKYLRVF